MKSKLLFNTISFIFLYSSFLHCGIMDWWYTYEDDNMSIVFPCTYSSNNENYGNGMSMKMVACDDDDMFFGISVMTFPNPYGKSSLDLLQSAVDMGSKQAGTKTYQKNISIKGYSGIEYVNRMHVEGSYAYAFTRVYYIKGKAYSIKILYKGDDYNKKLLNDFLSSFKPSNPF